MIDPAMLVILVFLIFALGIYLGIYHAADAQVRGEPREWWEKALYRAQQRTDYKEYCKRFNKSKVKAEVEE